MNVNLQECSYHGNLRVPPQCHPLQEIRPYEGIIRGFLVVNGPFISAFSLGGGVALGYTGPFDSHDNHGYNWGAPPSQL